MMLACPIFKYWHTARHLRSTQVVGQLRNRLRRLWEKPHRFAKSHLPGPFPGCNWRLHAAFPSPLPGGLNVEEMLNGRMTFINETHDAGWPPEWKNDAPSRLWRYNLHYFDWLWSLEYLQAVEAALHWMKNYPLRAGAEGWDPYPISLRLINWCGCFFDRFQQETEKDSELLNLLWSNIALQSDWLMEHLEYHLLGNHLLENAAALTIAGCCFNEYNAEQWRQRGLELLKEQLAEQILPDGMHFERSPMYHQRMTYLLLLLRNIDDEAVHAVVHEPLQRMLRAMQLLAHPDGQIALFNDSALNIYPSPKQLLNMAEQIQGHGIEAPPAGCWRLPDSGYYGWRDENGNYLIVDAGDIGPDCQPGHAHGDIFSFELSLGGSRVIVDSGVFDYIPGKMRDYCRSTRAHNTVELNEADQCEFWSAFRVARRGRARSVKVQTESDGFELDAWHDGYCRLPGAPSHTRKLHWKESTLAVSDHIVSEQNVRAVSRIHLHPDCIIQETESNVYEVSFPGGSVRIGFEGDGQASIESARYCPEFNQSTDAKSLSFRSEGRRIRIGYSINPIH